VDADTVVMTEMDQLDYIQAEFPTLDLADP